MSTSIDQFLSHLNTGFTTSTLRRIVLSAPAGKLTTEQPRRQTARPLMIKGTLHLQWELQLGSTQSHLNLTIEDSIERVRELFGSTYREAHLFCESDELVLRQQGTKTSLQHKQVKDRQKDSAPHHNRKKNYLIPEGKPCPFLIALGVMDSQGNVKASKQKKFRQINRYLEVINDTYRHLPEDGPLHIVDFGCGLSYLTFAAHYLFTEIHQRETCFYGIDQKQDVIDRCQKLAADLQLSGLQFAHSRIEEVQKQNQVHLAISLHACDTATDAALKFAVDAHADVILAVPCCQH